MKLSKPRLRRSFSGLWECSGGYTTYSLCPIKAYQKWLAKEQAEPHHLYSERTTKEMFERLDKAKKENPDRFEKKFYSLPERPYLKDSGVIVPNPNYKQTGLAKLINWFKGWWK